MECMYVCVCVCKREGRTGLPLSIREGSKKTPSLLLPAQFQETYMHKPNHPQCCLKASAIHTHTHTHICIYTHTRTFFSLKIKSCGECQGRPGQAHAVINKGGPVPVPVLTDPCVRTQGEMG